LIDAARNVLGTFAPSLSDAAEQHLQKLGVEIHLGQAVEKIDSEGVIVAGEANCEQDRDLDGRCYAFPRRKWLGVETDRAGPRSYFNPIFEFQIIRRFSWSAYGLARSGRENRWRASLKLQCNKDAMLEN